MKKINYFVFALLALFMLAACHRSEAAGGDNIHILPRPAAEQGDKYTDLSFMDDERRQFFTDNFSDAISLQQDGLTWILSHYGEDAFGENGPFLTEIGGREYYLTDIDYRQRISDLENIYTRARANYICLVKFSDVDGKLAVAAAARSIPATLRQPYYIVRDVKDTSMAFDYIIVDSEFVDGRVFTGGYAFCMTKGAGGWRIDALTDYVIN